MNLKKILPIIIALSAMPFLLLSQVTTSSISGIVKNNSGSTLPGTSVTATHVPTGTVYTAISRSGGRFDINNMNPGGPYTIAASFIGYEANTQSDIFLILGEIQQLNFTLTDKTTELTTVVLAGVRASSPKNGSEVTIGRDKLAVLPSVGRNINDFVKFTPQTKLTANGGISIAGQNNRYNGFLIDGAVNNDVFGISESGTNGGRANTPPISIDAVDQIVVQISPYDAALGNFTGGAINAITKAGTNNFHGSAYYVFRNQEFAGKTPGKLADSDRKKLSDFKNKTYGFTIGGPIIKNKAFFFLNVEQQKDSRPQPYTPTITSSGFNIKDTVAKLINHLRTVYNYDPGDYLNNPDEVDRLNINSRFDFNIGTKNKLSASYRYTKAERYNPGRSTNNTINFTNSAEFFPSTTHSGNIELNTKFSNKSNNKFRASFTDVVDDRGVTGTPFPNVSITGYNGGPTIVFGSEVASSANLLKQRIINFYDAFKYYTGKHAFTIGADIDFNKSYNLFMNRALGFYQYSAIGAAGPSQINPLAAFMQNLGPSRYRRAYSLVDAGNKGGDENVNSAADFRSVRLGFFINDDIKINDRLTLTLGLRADKTSFKTDVPVDKFFNDTALAVIAKVYNVEGARSGQKFSPSWQLSPRIGFKYIIDESITIRGGLGIFAGRTPLVWPGGLYQNTGVTIGAVDQRAATNAVVTIGSPAAPLPFRPDVNNQYTQTDFGLNPALLKPQGDINIIAKDFKLPSVFKTSMAVDKKLSQGWSISVEGLFTKNIQEVDWQNLNFAPPALYSSGPDRRLIYSYSGNPTNLVYRPNGATASAKNPYNNVILIRNTKGAKGYSYNFTFTIDKQAKKGFAFNAAYTYGNSMVHNEATSSINTSNWQNMEAVSSRNTLPLSISDFDMGHRVFVLASKKFTYFKEHLSTVIAFTYNGQSGSPFSYTMSNRNFIGDAVSFNDLMYVPASRSEMDQMVFLTRLSGAAATPAANAADIIVQKDEFESFIQSDKYLRKNRGRHAERNGARSPFTHIVDMSITQNFSLKTGAVRHNLSVRFDMFNFTNFINNNAGRQYFFNFDQATPLSFEGFTGSTPQYKFFKPTDNKPGAISDGVNPYNSSRWNGQLTIRYSF